MFRRGNVVPEIFIQAAGWNEELQKKLCHAYVTCPPGIEIKVTDLIEKEYIDRAKKEIIDVTKRSGSLIKYTGSPTLTFSILSVLPSY